MFGENSLRQENTELGQKWSVQFADFLRNNPGFAWLTPVFFGALAVLSSKFDQSLSQVTPQQISEGLSRQPAPISAPALADATSTPEHDMPPVEDLSAEKYPVIINGSTYLLEVGTIVRVVIPGRELELKNLLESATEGQKPDLSQLTQVGEISGISQFNVDQTDPAMVAATQGTKITFEVQFFYNKEMPKNGYGSDEIIEVLN